MKADLLQCMSKFPFYLDETDSAKFFSVLAVGASNNGTRRQEAMLIKHAITAVM